MDKLFNVDPHELLYMKNTLALDLIALDFWTHKSYQKLFSFILESAIDYTYENQDSLKTPSGFLMSSKEIEFETIKKGETSVTRASTFIGYLQNDLEKQIVRRVQS